MYAWLKKVVAQHMVPSVAVLMAALSFVVVRDGAWRQAIDWQTINLLFCLMFVVAGLRTCNLFAWLADQLLAKCHTVRRVSLALLLLTFFGAMLITNDVVLIVFVPFAIYLYNRLAIRRKIPLFLVLLTLAANIGSIATPIGNPQNLFLFSVYGIPTGAFFAATLPVTLFGGVLLCGCIACLPRRQINFPLEGGETLTHPKHVVLYLLLFILCLLSVFRVLPGQILFTVVVVSALFFARPLLRRIDYGLLLTFVAFFLFSHNITQIAWLESALSGWLERAPFLIGVAASQMISNVPAAILLQPFTADWQALLLGVNVGGVGTPIASLASLIALNLYLRERDARGAYYMRFFFLLNGLFLLALLLFAAL